jgi:hypothetical protein
MERSLPETRTAKNRDAGAVPSAAALDRAESDEESQLEVEFQSPQRHRSAWLPSSWPHTPPVARQAPQNPRFASGSCHATRMPYAHPPAPSAARTGARLYALLYPSHWSRLTFTDRMAPHDTAQHSGGTAVPYAAPEGLRRPSS